MWRGREGRPARRGMTDGRRLTRAGGSCALKQLVNRWPLERTNYRSIDEIPAESIAAIEIYESERDRPPGYYFEGKHECGLIQVWLWNSW